MARLYDHDDQPQISGSAPDLNQYESSQNSGSTPVLVFSARDYYDDQYRRAEISRFVPEEANLGFSKIREIEEEEGIHEANHKDDDNNKGNTISGAPLATIREERTGSSSLHSFDFNNNNGDVVFVAVGKSEETSMDALRWTMSNSVEPNSTLVFLIHIFPEVKQIPSPLGMMPIEQVNAKQKEMFLAQERGKRRDYLQKFIKVCSNTKVKVDTILIESSMESKAILDLIPILNIRTLVVGTSKRSIKSKKVSGTAGQILKGAPEYCDVKIVCEGKVMVDLMATDTITPRASNVSPSPSSSQSPRSLPRQQPLQQVVPNNSFIWSCFKPKVEKR